MNKALYSISKAFNYVIKKYDTKWWKLNVVKSGERAVAKQALQIGHAMLIFLCF